MTLSARTSLGLLLGSLACSPPPRAPASTKTASHDSKQKEQPDRASSSAQNSAEPAPQPALAPQRAPTSSADPEATDSEPPNSPQEAFCHGRSRCNVVGRIGKQLRKDGFLHSVQRIVLVTPEEERHPKGDDALGSCSVEEYWLLKTDAHGQLVDYQLLTGGCTGEDADEIWCGRAPSVDIEVSGADIRASWYSPFGPCWSAFSSSGSFTASLHDFKRHRIEAWTSHGFAGYTNGQEWNWNTRVGLDTFSFSGSPPDGTRPGDDRCPDIDIEVRSIPRFVMSSELSGGGWKTVNLEGCSTSFQAGSRSSDASKRATKLHAFSSLAGVLYLQLDPVLPPSNDAFFEICFGEEVLNDSSWCRYPVDETCARFSVAARVLEGELKVEKAPDAYRYAIDVSAHWSLRLVYRDRKNGAGIWSSPAGVTKRFAHSPLFSAETEKAKCVVAEEAAQLERRRPPQAEPLSTWPG